MHAGKKILILTAGFGEGHNTAARNVRAAIEDLTGGGASAQMIDPVEMCYGRVNDFAKKTYLGIINHIPFINRLVGWWAKLRDAGWLKTADAEKRAALKRDLHPIVEIYKQL